MRLLSALPFPLGSRPSGVELLRETGLHWDLAIGGVPFMLDTSQAPFERVTGDYLREQFDNSDAPGERSLSGWWLRSQARFDDGAGITYHEPLLGDGSEYRFRDSVGLDVFSDPNKVTLARKFTAATTTLGTPIRARASSTAVQILGSSKYGTVGSAGYLDGSAVETGPASLAVAPDDSIWTSATGAIYKDGVSTWTYAGNAPDIWWVKSRLFAAQGVDLLELSPAGGDMDAETPLSAPGTNTAGWQWVSVVETPSTVWAAGVDNFDQSRVFAITVDDASETVAVEAMTLPVGERILSAYGYLDYIILGTTAGMRVCPTSGTQALLGPILSHYPVYAITAYGESVYGATQATHDGFSGVIRLDLSNDLGEGYYPWARETYFPSSAQPIDIQIIPSTNRLCVITDDGVYIQGGSALDVGWIDTGLIRWGTWEDKWFESVLITGNTKHGSVHVASVDQNGNVYPLGSVAQSMLGKEVQVALPGAPIGVLGFRFTMYADESGQPTFTGYQVRGLPAPRRQRLLVVPLRIKDYQKDANGVEYGRSMFGAARQFALEVIEEEGRPVIFQDFRTGEVRRVVIEDLRHVQPDVPTRSDKNVEGITLVTLRSISPAVLGEEDFDRG